MDLNTLLKTSGINIKQMLLSVKGTPSFLRNYFKFKKLSKGYGGEFPITKLMPNLPDREEKAGSIPQHYFYQDLIIANKIFINNPELHVDIGSRIDGFIAHIASFRKVEVFDIRELNYQIPNVKFVKADIMSESFGLNDYCDSISCLHVIEHFGLGRYGDSLDFNGHIKGLNNIYKLLKQNGIFYFSTPIGPQRIEYDAHRVFSIRYLIDLFSRTYKINAFHYIDDEGRYYMNHNLSEEDIRNNCGCKFGCGMFELIKL